MVSSPSTGNVNDDSTYKNAPHNGRAAAEHINNRSRVKTASSMSRRIKPIRTTLQQQQQQRQAQNKEEDSKQSAISITDELDAAATEQGGNRDTEGDGVGYPSLFLQKSTPRTYSAVLRSTTVQNHLTEDHYCNFPLTILGKETLMTVRDAGGHAKIGTPNTDLEGTNGLYITPPIHTAQPTQNIKRLKRRTIRADGGRDCNIPQGKDTIITK